MKYLISRIAGLIIVTSLCASCGQTGKLFLPDKPDPAVPQLNQQPPEDLQLPDNQAPSESKN